MAEPTPHHRDAGGLPRHDPKKARKATTWADAYDELGDLDFTPDTEGEGVMATKAGGEAVSGPKRIQLRRTKGWHKPAGTISVARPSRWGNPFQVGGLYQVPGPSGRGAATARSPWLPPGAHVGVVADRADAVRLYRLWLTAGDYVADEAREQLAGHDLACWCPLDQPCHADVLLELANPGWAP